MAGDDQGPGTLTSDDVGSLTIATTAVISTRYAMAFAASIGDSNPRYFDDLAPGGVSVHPGVVFSMQWASRFRPDQEFNARAAPFGVHASTDLRIYRAFRVGEAVTTQGQILQKRQVKPGVYQVDRYRMTDSRGGLVAELYYNGITRGATLAGGDSVLEPEPTWPDISVENANTVLWREEIPIPLYAAQQYTECAQIYNPIHTEPSVAKAAGLPDIILHGTATKAISLSRVIDRCFGGDASRVTRLCGQLRGMVLLGTTISIEVLADVVVAGERRVLFRTLNAAGENAVSQGVVCGRA